MKKIDGNKNQKAIVCIDILKLIASIAVVAIHTYPLRSINPTADIFCYLLCTWAVPFFFAVSGYFLLKDFGVKSCSNRIKRQIIKIGKWYLLWSIIYSPIIFVRKISPYGNFVVGGYYELRDFICMGSYFQLWYLCAMIWCLIILLLANGRISIRKITVISLFLYLFNLLFTYFGEVLFPAIIYERINSFWTMIGNGNNGIFFGLVFLLVGKYVCEQKENFFKFKKKWIVFAGVFIAWITEGVLLYTFYGGIKQQMLTLIPLTYMAVSIGCNVKVNFTDRRTLRIRNISTLIFFTHTFNITFLNEIIEKLNIGIDGALFGSTLLFFITIVIISWFAAEVIIKFSEKWKILFHLYI